jgi:hypothetical protein
MNSIINFVNSVISFILRQNTSSLITGTRIFFHTFNLGRILRLAGHKVAKALRNKGIYIEPQKGQSGKPLCTVLLALFLIWVIIFSLFPLYCLIGGETGGLLAWVVRESPWFWAYEYLHFLINGQELGLASCRIAREYVEDSILSRELPADFLEGLGINPISLEPMELEDDSRRELSSLIVEVANPNVPDRPRPPANTISSPSTPDRPRPPANATNSLTTPDSPRSPANATNPLTSPDSPRPPANTLNPLTTPDRPTSTGSAVSPPRPPVIIPGSPLGTLFSSPRHIHPLGYPPVDLSALPPEDPLSIPGARMPLKNLIWSSRFN